MFLWLRASMPCRPLHEMATVAELGVFLYIVIVSDRKDDAEHQMISISETRMALSRAQAPLKLVEYF